MTTDRDALVKRINGYLAGGGLFNPELAIHDRVRDLLIDCRAALSAHGGEQTVHWKDRNATEYVEQSDTVSVTRAQMREWAEFWGHYSSVNEGCQDDMSEERNSVLESMLAAANEGKK